MQHLHRCMSHWARVCCAPLGASVLCATVCAVTSARVPSKVVVGNVQELIHYVRLVHVRRQGAELLVRSNLNPSRSIHHTLLITAPVHPSPHRKCSRERHRCCSLQSQCVRWCLTVVPPADLAVLTVCPSHRHLHPLFTISTASHCRSCRTT